MEDLWRANITLLDKLRDTGFIVDEREVEAVSSLERFISTYADREGAERIFLPVAGSVAAERNPRGVLVAFGAKPEEGKQVLTVEVRRVIEKLVNSGASTLYFIVDAPIYPLANKVLQSIQAEYRIVVYLQETLLFNITRHVWAPKHELLTPQAALEWLQTAGLRRNQMPRIYRSDPQAAYLDALSGDIIRVTRYSPTVDKFVHHVIVIDR